MTTIAIEASILSADFARLGEQAREAQAAGCDGLQIDVMDGRYVPNITFGPGFVQALRPLVDITLDVDLMIVEPERHLRAYAEAGADRLTVHLEACTHPYRILQLIRELGAEVGVAIGPGTPVAALEAVLPLVDLVQVMTVNPGWGGQPFLHDQVDKIRRLRQSLDERGLGAAIGVDGGIKPDTIWEVVESGATMVVSGSGIFNDRGTVAENVAALRARIGS